MKQQNTDEVGLKEPNKDSPKKKDFNQNRKTKRKKKKELAGTETEDFVPWSARPSRVVGEKAYMYPDDASGSEYVPSDDSDYQPSTDGESLNSYLSYDCLFIGFASTDAE